jgi:hypothetical protein
MKNLTNSKLTAAFALIVLALLGLAHDSAAQSYGRIYPKSMAIQTTGASRGISGSLWDNSLGASWYTPAWDYAYGRISRGNGDFQAFVSVTNGNFTSAVVPANQLDNFMNGRQYSHFATANIGFGGSQRRHGTHFQSLSIAHGTTVGFGVRTSQWSGHGTRSAALGYQTFLYSSWGFQPGENPRVNNGRYSTSAWARREWLGSYSLNFGPLDMGSGRTRRAVIGRFSTAIDRRGVCPYRYYFTTAQNLTASTASGVFVIPQSSEGSFLQGSPVSAHARLFNTSNGHLLNLPAGRSYSIVVLDGVNTTSSEGAQVVVFGQVYQ